jgi:hypothetical protein
MALNNETVKLVTTDDNRKVYRSRLGVLCHQWTGGSANRRHDALVQRPVVDAIVLGSSVPCYSAHRGVRLFHPNSCTLPVPCLRTGLTLRHVTPARVLQSCWRFLRREPFDIAMVDGSMLCSRLLRE